MSLSLTWILSTWVNDLQESNIIGVSVLQKLINDSISHVNRFQMQWLQHTEEFNADCSLGKLISLLPVDWWLMALIPWSSTCCSTSLLLVSLVELEWELTDVSVSSVSLADSEPECLRMVEGVIMLQKFQLESSKCTRRDLPPTNDNCLVSLAVIRLRGMAELDNVTWQ